MLFYAASPRLFNIEFATGRPRAIAVNRPYLFVLLPR
jgi:hypothetical protein